MLESRLGHFSVVVPDRPLRGPNSPYIVGLGRLPLGRLGSKSPYDVTHLETVEEQHR